MGTLTAGIKEIFSSAKTTGSNVMLCGNDGTPDGHMTMANLASVLGAFTYKGKGQFDYDNINSDGWNISWFAEDNYQSYHAPFAGSQIIITLVKGSDRGQLVLSKNGKLAFRLKDADGESSWFIITIA